MSCNQRISNSTDDLKDVFSTSHTSPTSRPSREIPHHSFSSPCGAHPRYDVSAPELTKPMFIVFDCPKCGVELEVDDSGVGEQISCPKCNTKIRIPEPDAPGVKVVTAAGEESAEADGEAAGWTAPTANP